MSTGKLVRGWGVNDLGYKVAGKVNGKWRVTCPFYEVWSSILARTCAPKEKRTRPYWDAVVCDEWKYVSAFKEWMQEQPWKGNHCDKDVLIPGNKEYGPYTCKFIPVYINSLLISGNKRDMANNHIPMGVYLRDRKLKPYVTSITDVDGKYMHLGYFKTAQEAHEVWQLAKADRIEKTVAKYALEDCFDTEVADSLMWRAWKLRNDSKAGIVTTSL